MISYPEERKQEDQERAYAKLEKVLGKALDQAATGKGAERHATANNFEDQPICVIQRLLKDHPFGALAFQVIKKTVEAGRLLTIRGPVPAVAELRGAINYLGAMIIVMQETREGEIQETREGEE